MNFQFFLRSFHRATLNNNKRRHYVSMSGSSSFIHDDNDFKGYSMKLLTLTIVITSTLPKSRLKRNFEYKFAVRSSKKVVIRRNFNLYSAADL